MVNKELLNEIVIGMNKGYFESSRGKEKVYPMHSHINKLISSTLGKNYDGHGYGLMNENEFVLTTNSNVKWKPDGFFHLEVPDISLVIPKGLAIDYKAPFSNILQNDQNFLKALSGEATRTRPYGNLFAAFIMVPETAPYFTKEGKLDHMEKCAESVVSEWKKWALSDNSIDGSPDLVGVCVYRLKGFDYSNIFDREDFINLLKDFNGVVEFAETKSGITTDRFIYNDIVLFAKNAAKMLVNKFGGTKKDKTFADLFLETPISEQEKYLVEHGKLTYVPSFV